MVRTAMVAMALVAACGRPWHGPEDDRIDRVCERDQADPKALDGIPVPNVPDRAGPIESSPPMSWKAPTRPARGKARGARKAGARFDPTAGQR